MYIPPPSVLEKYQIFSDRLDGSGVQAFIIPNHIGQFVEKNLLLARLASL